jgi:hypothetical protein
MGPSILRSNFDSRNALSLCRLTFLLTCAEFPTLHLDSLVYLIAGPLAKVQHNQVVKYAHGDIMCVPPDLKNERSPKPKL